MLRPVRCFTCGKVMSEYIYSTFSSEYEKINKKCGDDSKEYESEIKSLYIKLGLRRYCCKTIVLTAMDFSDDMLEYV